MTTGSLVARSTYRRKTVDRKNARRVIAIDSAREVLPPQGPPTQPANSKRPFFGNQHTRRAFVGMFHFWAAGVATRYRIPTSALEQQVIEGLAEERHEDEVFRKAQASESRLFSAKRAA